MEFCFRQDKFEGLGKVVHASHHIHVSLDPLDVGCKHLRLSGRRKNCKAGWLDKLLGMYSYFSNVLSCLEGHHHIDNKLVWTTENKSKYIKWYTRITLFDFNHSKFQNNYVPILPGTAQQLTHSWELCIQTTMVGWEILTHGTLHTNPPEIH